MAARHGGVVIEPNADEAACRAQDPAPGTVPSAQAELPQQPGLSAIGELKAVLRIRPFRRLWMVLGLSSLGDWLGLLATWPSRPSR